VARRRRPSKGQPRKVHRCLRAPPEIEAFEIGLSVNQSPALIASSRGAPCPSRPSVAKTRRVRRGKPVPWKPRPGSASFAWCASPPHPQPLTDSRPPCKECIGMCANLENLRFPCAGTNHSASVSLRALHRKKNSPASFPPSKPLFLIPWAPAPSTHRRDRIHFSDHFRKKIFSAPWPLPRELQRRNFSPR
jgi:hypothetical protein